ncbi:hypothetical protein [Olivibacter domesticus]|nr:hypothetical protein [Olivibacter domesticus]
MENILLKKGIKVVTTMDDTTRLRFFFTDKMLATKTFIVVEDDTVLTTLDSDFLFEEIPEEETSEGEMTGLSLKEFLEDRKEEEPVKDDLINEISVTLITANRLFANEFALYYNGLINDVRPVAFPLVLYRLILDAVELIDSADPLSLQATYSQISTGCMNTQIVGDLDSRKQIQKHVEERIEMALNLIKEQNPDVGKADR